MMSHGSTESVADYVCKSPHSVPETNANRYVLKALNFLHSSKETKGYYDVYFQIQNKPNKYKVNKKSIDDNINHL